MQRYAQSLHNVFRSPQIYVFTMSYTNVICTKTSICLPGIHLYIIRNDKNWNRDANAKAPQRGGGVGLYIKESLVSDVNIFKIFNSSNKDIEIQWVKLNNKFAKDLIVLNVYRPPTGNIDNFIDTIEKCNPYIRGGKV